MLNLKLSAATQKNISDCVGRSYDSIVTLSPEEEKTLIGKSVKFSTKRKRRIVGRGNPLLSRRRFRTLEEVEDKLKEIK